MDKVYKVLDVEKKWYEIWEKNGYFIPKIDPNKKPFTIILPLPNANDSMHMGHAMFTVEDIMIRYHRMLGESTLWLPGGDHAGIETQYVFEKKLAKEGKSRFDYDRDTLYRMIAEFVDGNKNINRDQMKRLGFSLDWTRYHFSLEPEIVAKVLDTFRKLHKDGLIYRTERLVNYCLRCGTAFSELEVNHVKREDNLYYLDYGQIKIATARPETIFADVAVAVHPKDKRYTKLIGKTAVIPLVDKKIPIIADEAIEIGFGTGALKVTPAHDEKDFEIGQKNNLPIINTIDRSGRMINIPDKYLGMKIQACRKAVIEDLKLSGKLIKSKPLTHTISVCYRCKTVIEPLLMPQWFVKMKPLAKLAIKAVKEGRTKIVPLPRFKKLYFGWMENIRDWNISRQIVWGPRLPVWYCLDCNPEIEISFIAKSGQKITGNYQDIKVKNKFSEIESGIQNLVAPLEATYSLDNSTCAKCHGSHLLQETDTFDTWFLSGQWPLTTLGYPDSRDFKYFYPTSVLDTLWDILFFWVARMMMFGLYLAGEVPFKIIHLHCRVVDKHGQKMSKSKGNVINPIEMADKYGADALRMALVYGTAPGSDIAISEDKIRGMRNFGNKLWNIARFIKMNKENYENYQKEVLPFETIDRNKLHEEDKQYLAKLGMLITKVTKYMENYRFDYVANSLYEFLWHEFADNYIEAAKPRLREFDRHTILVMEHIFLTCMKMLHPIMPFITEEINASLANGKTGHLTISAWPA